MLMNWVPLHVKQCLHVLTTQSNSNHRRLSKNHVLGIYTMEFYEAERKKELIPFAMAWMELESIMLSEISQAVGTNTV